MNNNKIIEDFSSSLKDDISELFSLLAEEIKKYPVVSSESEPELILEEDEFVPPIEKIDLSVKSDDLSDFFNFLEHKTEPEVKSKIIEESITESLLIETTPKNSLVVPEEIVNVKPILPKIESNETKNINLSDINIRINNLINDTNRKLQKLFEYSTLAYGGGSGSYWLNDLGDTDHNSLIGADNGDVLSFDTSKNKWIASKGTNTVKVANTQIVFGTGDSVSSSANLVWFNNTLNSPNIVSNIAIIENQTSNVITSNTLNSNIATIVTQTSNVITANTFSVQQNLYLKTQKQTLANLSGNTVITTGTIIPDGSFVMGVTTKVTDTLLSANGYSVGTELFPTLWGTKNANTIGTITKSSDYVGYDSLGLFTENSNVMISTTGSAFTGGSIEVSTFYFITEVN